MSKIAQTVAGGHMSVYYLLTCAHSHICLLCHSLTHPATYSLNCDVPNTHDHDFTLLCRHLKEVHSNGWEAAQGDRLLKTCMGRWQGKHTPGQQHGRGQKLRGPVMPLPTALLALQSRSGLHSLGPSRRKAGMCSG